MSWMLLTSPDILTIAGSASSLESEKANRQLLGPARVRRFPLVQAAAAAAAASYAAAVGLLFLKLAAAAVYRCRCCFSYLLLRCWMAAFVACLGEMVVFSRRVFNVSHGTCFWIRSVVLRLKLQAQQAALFWSVRSRDIMIC